jgi:hypothetical protein
MQLPPFAAAAFTDQALRVAVVQFRTSLFHKETSLSAFPGLVPSEGPPPVKASLIDGANESLYRSLGVCTKFSRYRAGRRLYASAAEEGCSQDSRKLLRRADG